MSCECAKFSIDEGYICTITDSRCVYFIPSSKQCAKDYGEGPDANKDGD